jgi:hypothetical protein
MSGCVNARVGSERMKSGQGELSRHTGVPQQTISGYLKYFDENVPEKHWKRACKAPAKSTKRSSFVSWIDRI